MTISELIKLLEEILDQHGDVCVHVTGDDGGEFYVRGIDYLPPYVGIQIEWPGRVIIY